MQCLYKNTRRCIEWEQHQTRIFPTNKGLRQGCPLSPILFALYVAHIPEAIDETVAGVKVGAIKMTNLFYADDIVLMTEEKKDMYNGIDILNKELEALDLGINFNKSKIIKMGPGSTMAYLWEVRDRQGHARGTLSEVPEYKYLGVIVGKGKLYAKHIKKITSRTPGAAMSVIGRARQSMSRDLVAEALWQMSLKRRLIFASGAVVFPNACIRKLEVGQRKVAKWILGVHSSANNDLVEMIIDWLPVRTEVEKSVIMLWGRVMKMEEGRIPRRMLDDMMKNGHENEWYEEVKRILEKYSLSPWMLMERNWAQNVKNQVESIVREKWRKGDRVDESVNYRLLAPEEENMKRMGRQVGNGIRQAVCRDRWSIVGNIEGDECPVCGIKWEDWLKHITIECRGNESQCDRAKGWEGVCSSKKLGEMVSKKDWEGLERVGKTVNEWMKVRKGRGDAR